MRRILIVFAVLGLAAAFKQGIVTDTSQLIDDDDIRQEDEVEIVCPGAGCTIYTTKLSAPSVGLYRGQTLLTTLDKIFQLKDGFLVGYHLTAGADYRLRKIPNTLVEGQKVYVVFDGAGIGAVTAFDTDTWNGFDIKPSGRRLVTVLTATSVSGYRGLSFSSYAGPVRPMLYATGFDGVGVCKAVYKATSAHSASISTINIRSSIVTIDFMSTDSSNKYSVQQGIVNTIPAAIGQSTVAMSPGYTGCPNPGFLAMGQAAYRFTVNEPIGIAVKFDDLAVKDAQALSVQIDDGWGNYWKCEQIIGNVPQELFVTTDTSLSLNWTPKDPHDQFSAQFDFVCSGASMTGLLSMMSILLALL